MRSVAKGGTSGQPTGTESAHWESAHGSSLRNIECADSGEVALPDEGAKQIEAQNLGDIADRRFARGFLQDQHVSGLKQKPFLRVTQGPIQIDLDGYLAAIRRSPKDGEQAGRREA